MNTYTLNAIGQQAAMSVRSKNGIEAISFTIMPRDASANEDYTASGIVSWGGTAQGAYTLTKQQLQPLLALAKIDARHQLEQLLSSAAAAVNQSLTIAAAGGKRPARVKPLA